MSDNERLITEIDSDIDSDSECEISVNDSENVDQCSFFISLHFAMARTKQTILKKPSKLWMKVTSNPKRPTEITPEQACRHLKCFTGSPDLRKSNDLHKGGARHPRENTDL
ncbi:hypothetical protein TNCV_3791061 [Trichonephila clavipes]|nr:hypothetical protein TNCV_3791061 [Trichonephila clavipes]